MRLKLPTIQCRPCEEQGFRAPTVLPGRLYLPPRVDDPNCLTQGLLSSTNSQDFGIASGIGVALGTAGLTRAICPAVGSFPTITWTAAAGPGYVAYGAFDAESEKFFLPDLGNDQFMHVIDTAQFTEARFSTPEGFGTRYPIMEYGSREVAVIDQTGKVCFYNAVTNAFLGSVATPNVAAGPFFCIAGDTTRKRVYTPALGGPTVVGPTVISVIDALTATLVNAYSFAVHGGTLTFAENADKLLIASLEATGPSFWYFDPVAHTLTSSAISSGAPGGMFYIRELGVVAFLLSGQIRFINPINDTIVGSPASGGASHIYGATLNSCSNLVVLAVGAVIQMFDPNAGYALVGQQPILANSLAFDKYTGLGYAVLGNSNEVDSF